MAVAKPLPRGFTAFMSGTPDTHRPPLRWRLECLGHSLVEGLAGCLPGAWVFRLGEMLGGIGWHFMPQRRRIILRNLRIAFAGEKELPELRRMARASFRRTAANLISAAHTARLPAARLGEVIHIENIGLLEDALAGGRGVVLLLSHMGNWEILSRLVHLFPKDSKAGAFYRPLNNRLLDERVLGRRQADGTRMFSKGDNPLHVAAFLREGGIVGILADQRVGHAGELVEFFGRLTKASPLPSLLARRAKSAVLALSVTTVEPGKWKAVFLPVTPPPGTPHCMESLEHAMKAGPVDVFWFQERWKIYTKKGRTIRDWLGSGSTCGRKPHRALLWLCGVSNNWQLPDAWKHPDVTHEVVLAPGTARPPWLPESIRIHEVAATTDRDMLQKQLAAIDGSAVLPLDYILAPGASKPLVKAGLRESIPVIPLP